VNLLFLHQNMPGQFRHLIAHLRGRPDHRVVCVSRRADFAPPGIGRAVYELPQSMLPEVNPFLTPLETAIRHGMQAARACQALRENGFIPDLIVAHPGWGESLFVKDVFPRTPVLNYCEFFYRPFGADTNYDPTDQQDFETNCATRTRNAHLLMALEAGDWGVSPTMWQKSLHPHAFQDRISVCFDGIDTNGICPDPSSTFTLPTGRVLSADNNVVTYVARGLEPYRGFPSLMRALPLIQARCPKAEIVIVGADEVYYGKPPDGGMTWRAVMEREIDFDASHVHFVGRIAYSDYVRLLRISTVHVYLTVPFVLSWSMLEAMAAGCVVVGSSTPPVLEVIEDGVNGFTADFFSPDMIAARVVEAVRNRSSLQSIRQAARWTAISRFSIDRCLPQQMALLETLAAGQIPPGRL
jgi:glycosyltransferase involved in cell wall biosynthesis